MKKFLHIFFICIVAASALALTGGSGCKCVDCSTPPNFTRNPNIHDFPANSVANPGMFTVSPDDKYLYLIDNTLSGMPYPYPYFGHGSIARIGLLDGTVEIVDTTKSTYFISCSPDGKYLITCQRDSATPPFTGMSLYVNNLQASQKKKIQLQDSMSLSGAFVLTGDTSAIGVGGTITTGKIGFFYINLNSGQDSLLFPCARGAATSFDVSADGKYAVYTDTNNNAILHDIITGSERLLGFSTTWMRFSPDGTQIAYNSRDPLPPPTVSKLFDIVSGQSTTLDMNVGAYGQVAYYLAWEHSQRNLLYSAAVIEPGDPGFIDTIVLLYVLQL